MKSVAHVPVGFVLLASYDTRGIGDHRRPPTGDYARLLREVESKNPSIRAFKDKGKWVALKSDVEEFIRNQSEKRNCVSVKKATKTVCTVPDDVTRDLLSSIDSTLHEVSKAAGRVAAAVELLTGNLRTNDGPTDLVHVLSGLDAIQQQHADVEE